MSKFTLEFVADFFGALAIFATITALFFIDYGFIVTQ